MCGITGIMGPNTAGMSLKDSLSALSKRGPDRQAELRSGSAILGHTRLSIIDTSSLGDQPMQDPSARYTLVFNGEIYNYRSIAKSLQNSGIELRSSSDTEVLLHLLIAKGKAGLSQLNGFFSFAFYDAEEDELLIARDRIGIKPLYFSHKDDQLYFSSELKGLAPLIGEQKLDHDSLHLYLRFNYLPPGASIFSGTQQLGAGEYLRFKAGRLERGSYYEVEGKTQESSLRELLEDSVRLRLVADVPLGSFLSGGVDSSLIAAIAKKQRSQLKTFSIGFKDMPHFDESLYAEQVAKHIGSDHKTIQLYEDEMLEHVFKLLDYVDEPFADSSAIAVHALSHHTRKEVTVALSGDGADELFGGYNKHQAHLRALNPGMKENLVRILSPLLEPIHGGHGSAMSNRLRQVKRFARGANLSALERYWAWASWTDQEEVSRLLSVSSSQDYQKKLQLSGPRNASMEEVLLADTRMLLPSDMLTKVDRMSMANSLEVRVPFLDHRVVEYAHSLSASQRLKMGQGKFILQQEFADLLPSDIFSRRKKGFEVPLEAWFNGPLYQQIHDVLNKTALRESGLFHLAALDSLKKDLEKKNIGSVVHLLWALMIFERFYSEYGY